MSSIMDPARPQYAMKPIGMLAGYQNGRLDDLVLTAVVRGLKANLCSARKFKALQAAAVYNGIPLSSTGIYRSFEQQEWLFYSRYDRGYIAGRAAYRNYLGSVWSLKVGYAQAATPGTSNHGYGRSNDLAVMLEGDTIPDSLRSSDKTWLATNAPSFGLFFEATTEDWHCTDYAGDDIPQLVIDWETGTPENPAPGVPPFDPASGQFSLYPLDTAKAKLQLTDPQMHSELVSYFQGVLRVKLGYAVKIDGWFGPGTRDFAVWFQATHGLVADGIVGKNTWAAIDKVAVT